MNTLIRAFWIVLFICLAQASLADDANTDSGTGSRVVNFWTGTTSTAWATTTNWSLGHMPLATEDVAIPGSLSRYPLIASASRSCNSLGIASGASLTIGSGSLTANADCGISGTLIMNNAAGVLNVLGDLTFSTDGTASITAAANINVQGDLEFLSGSSVNMATGTLTLYGSGSSNIVTGTVTSVNNLTAGKNSGGSVNISAASGANLSIGGNLAVNAGSTLTHAYEGTTILKGNLASAGGGLVSFDSGTLSLEGSGSSSLSFADSGSYLNFLIINKAASATTVNLLSYLDVNENLILNTGTLNSNSQTIYLAGSWWNNQGPDYFIEGTGTVVFNGNRSQDLSTETFYTLQQATAAGIFTNPGQTVTIAHYDYEFGLNYINGGTFIALDLVDAGIIGYITVADGLLELHQDSLQRMDLNGNLHITGGTVNIYGGSDEFLVANMGPASLDLNGGVLDIKEKGIRITNYNPLWSNVTGGIIKTTGRFKSDRPDYHPWGGTVELYGNAVATIECVAGSTLCDLKVNKGGSAYVNAGSVIQLTGDLFINAGSYHANNYNFTLAGDIFNYVGSSGFEEGTATVIFNGTTDQLVLGNTEFRNVVDNNTGTGLVFSGWTNVSGSFNVSNRVEFQSMTTLASLVNTNPAGYVVFMDDSGISSYAGGGTLKARNGCTLWILDITGSGFTGSLIADFGFIAITQDAASRFDLNCAITITSSGSVDLYGGNGDISFAHGGNASFTMESGSLSVHDRGLTIENSGFACNFDISGGTINCDGNWTDDRGSFDPSGGYVVFTGTADAVVRPHSNSWFAFLKIDKTGADSDVMIHQCVVKNGFTQQAARIVSLQGNLSILNDSSLTLTGGTLSLGAHTLTATGNNSIYGTLKLASGSTLLIASARAITFFSGARLETLGSASLPALISHHNTGTYSLHMESGSTIAAEYTIFEYLNINGINIKTGSSVDPEHSLDYCTFRYGVSGGRMLTINNNQTFSVYGAVYPANTWSGAYNVYKSGTAGVVTFYNASGGFSGEGYDYDPNNLINWSFAPVITSLNISHLAASNRIQLTWTCSETVYSFKIYRSTMPEGPFSLAAIVTSGYTWSEPTPGRNYFYRIIAVGI